MEGINPAYDRAERGERVDIMQTKRGVPDDDEHDSDALGNVEPMKPFAGNTSPVKNAGCLFTALQPSLTILAGATIRLG